MSHHCVPDILYMQMSLNFDLELFTCWLGMFTVYSSIFFLVVVVQKCLKFVLGGIFCDEYGIEMFDFMPREHISTDVVL